MTLLKFYQILNLNITDLNTRQACKQITSLKLDEVDLLIAKPLKIELIEAIEIILTKRCRVCGCNEIDCSNCIKRTGEPCSWPEEDLCSACI